MRGVEAYPEQPTSRRCVRAARVGPLRPGARGRREGRWEATLPVPPLCSATGSSACQLFTGSGGTIPRSAGSTRLECRRRRASGSRQLSNPIMRRIEQEACRAHRYSWSPARSTPASSKCATSRATGADHSSRFGSSRGIGVPSRPTRSEAPGRRATSGCGSGAHRAEKFSLREPIPVSQRESSLGSRSAHAARLVCTPAERLPVASRVRWD
jgi:hypothetical protein